MGLAEANSYTEAKLLNSKVLLYSTGSYSQYPMINHKGTEYEKEYLCTIESLCYTAEINTVNHYTSIIFFLKKPTKLQGPRICT